MTNLGLDKFDIQKTRFGHWTIGFSRTFGLKSPVLSIKIFKQLDLEIKNLGSGSVMYVILVKQPEDQIKIRIFGQLVYTSDVWAQVLSVIQIRNPGKVPV